MSNNLTLADAINEALDTGKEATFLYNGTLYIFSPAGIISFLTAEGGFGEPLPFTVPTSDPGVSGEIWNDNGVLKSSAGA